MTGTMRFFIHSYGFFLFFCRTFTGAPGKRFRVKTAAQSSVGASSASSVRFISAVAAPPSSAGSKLKLAVPLRKPAGSLCGSSAARYAASLLYLSGACRPDRP